MNQRARFCLHLLVKGLCTFLRVTYTLPFAHVLHAPQPILYSGYRQSVGQKYIVKRCHLLGRIAVYYSRVAASLGGTFLWAHAYFLDCVSKVPLELLFCFIYSVYIRNCRDRIFRYMFIEDIITSI